MTLELNSDCFQFQFVLCKCKKILMVYLRIVIAKGTISKKGVIKYKVNLRLGLFSLASFSQTDKQTYTSHLLRTSCFLYTQTLLTTQ